MVLTVTEYANQPPHQQEATLNHRTINGNTVWGGRTIQIDEPSARIDWVVEAPDGGLYVIVVQAPGADVTVRTTEVEAMFATLHLEPWSVPQDAVNGLVHLEFSEGFSFDYPAGWSVYYPVYMTMGGGQYVVISSKPPVPSLITPECRADGSCASRDLWQPFIPGSYHMAPGSILISFDSGGRDVDWATAPTTLAGQPAFFSSDNTGSGVDESGSWAVRLEDTGTGVTSLGIRTSILGPGAPALHAALGEVIASLRITPTPSPTP
jgi:hypothetical protein